MSTEESTEIIKGLWFIPRILPKLKQEIEGRMHSVILLRGMYCIIEYVEHNAFGYFTEGYVLYQRICRPSSIMHSVILLKGMYCTKEYLDLAASCIRLFY